jgi:hypothetical protein
MTVGVTIGPGKLDQRSFQELCDKLVVTCNGHRLDDTTAAMAATLVTFLLKATRSREEVDRVFGRVVVAMREHIDMSGPPTSH